MLKLISRAFLILLFIASGLQAATSSSSANSCDELQKLWNEGWTCSNNCWDKVKGPCNDLWVASGEGGKACSTWIGPAAAVSVVLLALAGAYYLVRAANTTVAVNSGGPVLENIDLLPTRAEAAGAPDG